MLTAPAAGTALAQSAAAPAAVSSAAASDTAVASESASDSASATASSAAPALLKSQVPLKLDGAGTAWLIVATAFVLMMTVPGLALFYGGMVRRKNLIATVTQSVAVTSVVMVVWYLIEYSISFGVGSGKLGPLNINDYIGGFDLAFLHGVTNNTAYTATPGIPEMCWIAYQATFAIITPALITGAFAERVKFSGLLLFMVLWSVFVYGPICHMVWGGGILAQKGVIDFAGGSVVHCNSGVAGLVSALFLGRRKGYGTESMPANNPIFVMIGASLLFVGWIGFNAGSEWAADSIASAALLNTMIATCAAGLSWKVVEWIFRGKPSLIGILSGWVAGLVVITPACGFVTPMGAIIIGLIGGAFCYFSATWVKKLLGYDDSLDAFGVHGAGGFIGALLTGYFADPSINPLGHGSMAQVMTQLMGLGVVIAWSGIGTLLILIICKFTTGLRVSEADELAGLDASQHDEVMDH
jgi:Amt family ammonium transporter